MMLMEQAGAYGAVGALRPVNTYGSLPAALFLVSAGIDNHTVVAGRFDAGCRQTHGSGRSWGTPDRARLLATSEAMERYASFVADESAQVTASAVELGAPVLDLDTVARCSQRELRRPGCPLRPADKTRPIRWNEAVDLHTGRDLYVPSVMTHMSSQDLLPAERFWQRISTGVATHTSTEAATLNAIAELVERDAIALTWLQRLPLPRLDLACISDQGRQIIDWCDRQGIDVHLFDATTDVGLPIVYCVQTLRTPRADVPAQYIGCAADFSVPDAAEHALLEALGIPIAVFDRMQVPRRYADYATEFDGGLCMGRPSRRSAFGFLLDDPDGRPVSTPRSPVPGTDVDPVPGRLAFLLRRLRELGMSVYAVDISTRELDDAGLVAIRVIIPQLQPMSLRPLAQYRGHPRLYQAPAAMGMRVLPERHLNPYPQPMM